MIYYNLVNPNKLRHYGNQVQDNPMSESPLSIITEDGEFSMELPTEETIIFANTHPPSDNQLQECPYINLS